MTYVIIRYSDTIRFRLQADRKFTNISNIRVTFMSEMNWIKMLNGAYFFVVLQSVLYLYFFAKTF